MLLVEMAYPASFDLEKFKAIKSYAGRLKYATENLPKKMGTGSSRAVFQIDDQKVLKIARNAKGIAQNEAEGQSDYYRDKMDILAHVFDVDEENYTWIEMEKADKINKARFQQLTGIAFGYYVHALGHEWYRKEPRQMNFWKQPNALEGHDKLWENEFFTDVIEFLVNYDMPFADFMQLKHYGEVNGRCVIIDYGATKDVIKSHYSR